MDPTNTSLKLHSTYRSTALKLCCIALIVASSLTFQPAAAEVPTVQDRVAADDAVDAAVALSQIAFDAGGADHVVLVSDDDPEAALLAPVLAGRYGPVLYIHGPLQRKFPPQRRRS